MIQIFVCINDIPLLNVTFLYVSKYTDDNTFSRNFCPQERKFQGTNVPWNESSMEHLSLRTKVHGDESSRERKFHHMALSSLGTKVLRDESSIIQTQAPSSGCFNYISARCARCTQCVRATFL